MMMVSKLISKENIVDINLTMDVLTYQTGGTYRQILSALGTQAKSLTEYRGA